MNLNRIREKMIVYCIHVVKNVQPIKTSNEEYIPAQKDYLYFSLCKKNYSAKKFISSVDKKKQD